MFAKFHHMSLVECPTIKTGKSDVKASSGVVCWLQGESEVMCWLQGESLMRCVGCRGSLV